MKKYLIVLLTLFIYTCSDDPAAPKEGCTSMTACNYDATAAVDDGSCLEPVTGECCTDDNQVSTPDCADTCGGTAVEDCAGTCNGPGIPDGNGDCCASGTLDCLNVCDGSAVTDCNGVCDGSGVLDDCGVCDGDSLSCAGCTDSTACNYNDTATIDDGSCDVPDSSLCETCVNDASAVTNDADGDGICDADEVTGCTDSSACNYDSTATDDDGSCAVNDTCGVCDGDNSTCSGCTDASACNYDDTAIVDDASCDVPDSSLCETCVNGASAVTDDADGDGVCDADEVAGCTDASACNYDSTATDDDGSCAVDDACGVCGGDGSSCAGGDLTCTDLTTACTDATDCNTLALDPTTGDVYYHFTNDIAGVQFDIVGGTATSASGGAASSAGWILNAAGATVLGFSFSNATIDSGCTGATPCSGVLFTIAGDVANATGLDTIVATTADSSDVTTATSTDACE